jgi:hypothetical protein
VAHVEGNAAAKADVDAARGNVDVNRGQVNADVNRSVRINDRNAFVERNAKLGDRNYDRRGIGALEEGRYANNRDNNWRYRRWGDEWWYWLPTGSWDYWRAGRWYPYDVNSYTYENEPAPVTAANFNGPYYESQNGFYYMDGSRRVYDPQIRRVAGEVGTLPSPAMR